MKETRGRKWDLDTIIKCGSCGKEIRYGDSFSSLELRDKLGRLENVCGDCSKQECKRMEEGTTKWQKSVAKRR